MNPEIAEKEFYSKLKQLELTKFQARRVMNAFRDSMDDIYTTPGDEGAGVPKENEE